MPAGAIIRTEFDTVVIQQDVCNGHGDCVPACPFGVPQLSAADGNAHKCTLCYDRLVDGLELACAKACPTDSIQFGLVEELMAHAETRVDDLQTRGVEDAYIYGDRQVGGTHGIDGLNAFFILTAPPRDLQPSCGTAPAAGSGAAGLPHDGRGRDRPWAGGDRGAARGTVIRPPSRPGSAGNSRP